MHNIIPYYKPLGFTPLQAIEQLKIDDPQLADIPVTYAGRLDPMAEGLLLLLTGDMVKRKQEFLDLPKTYEAKILLGFSSDTFDVLGLADANADELQHKDPQEIIDAVHRLVGAHNFPYPPYSSKTVDGKPLWLLARENKITEADLPRRETSVTVAEEIKVQKEQWQNIYSKICSSINLVTGDFRQQDILRQWAKINESLKSSQQLQIVSVKFTVSSGTYIRTLAHELGKVVGTQALLLHLKRVSIGDYKI